MERKGFLDRLLQEDARITEDRKLALQELCRAGTFPEAFPELLE
jgi:hypothetical protein